VAGTVSAVALTIAASSSDGPLPGERPAIRWIHESTPAPVESVGGVLDPLLTDITAPAVYLLLVGLVWRAWGRAPAAVMALAGAGTGLTRIADLVERPRPTSDLAWQQAAFGSGGYPSGHAVFAVLVFGTIAVLARRHAHPQRRRWIIGGLSLLVAVICWTRVSALEHWPADVLGGASMAGVALLAVVWAERRLAALAGRWTLLDRILGW